MSQPLISVLIPTHNAAPYLNQLCRSVQAQTYENFEVLIADDGSTDPTLEVLKPFQADPRFRILSWPKNRGVTAATRVLFDIFRGDYWCHPGADDVLFPQFIEKRLALMETNPSAAMSYGGIEYIDESGKTTAGYPVPAKLPAQMDGSRALSALLQHNFINTPSIMARSSVTRRVLPFFIADWRYAQDWYLWLLHFATGGGLLWDPEPLHQYRIHSQSLSKSPTKSAVRQAEIRLVPLCGLNAAAQISPIAAALWEKWKCHLYVLWLRRALSLCKEKLLEKEWLQIGAQAFYGTARPNISLLSELFLHGIKIIQVSRKEKNALAGQSFRVSGLAQINDPIFS
ncbi:MAG: glycosyltransferase [Verrucomicrobiota bacterium]